MGATRKELCIDKNGDCMGRKNSDGKIIAGAALK